MIASTLSFVAFDEFGQFVDRPGFEAQLGSAADNAPTDVFLLSHGWKNSFEDASRLYTGLLAQLSAVSDSAPSLQPPGRRVLALGVIWPSKAWDEESEGTSESAGTARRPAVPSLADSVYDVLSPERSSPAGFRHDVLLLQQFLVKDHLGPADRERMVALLRRHADLPSVPEDESVFDPEAPAAGLQGLAAGDFSARDVFRTFTYWQMKKRAGVVGQAGVRAAVAVVQGRLPAARIHLVGHSFGCKVALAAVAGPGEPPPRPVQTVVLLQGAVSYEAMAERVTGTRKPGGYRAAVDPGRIDGPIVATYSRLDKACSQAYPLGSRLAGQVGELEGLLDRFRALGAVGASGVGEEIEHFSGMHDVGGAYDFSGPGVWSIDGGTEPSAFITGHSDILSPQVAWLILSAIWRR